ncbi:SAM-dependent methyltransferase [Pseudanabaenaceae cyanobacterium LEGE 13415]|nr:SAM-dependent methyltransferase [Pseudanabaenaceae cyanobacterium LEGE 13415]
MDLALYCPQLGYYARSREKIGAQGDFFTSPHLSFDFGELIAEQLAEMWQILGQPNPFTIIELGAGQGVLAADVLRYLSCKYPDCFNCLTYVIGEKAAAHVVEQRYRLRRWIEEGVRIEWKSIEEPPADSITGCVFSNELIDAFPVHLVEVRDRTLKEIYVQLEENRFAEVVGDLSSNRITDYFKFVGVDILNYAEGYRTEVNLAALDWMNTIAQKLNRGFVLTIDYGYPATRYYNPMRSQGTLQCYYQHSHHNDPYIYVGEQDITAHVDFTALQLQGERSGLRTEGFTQQGLFLMSLGLGDRLTQITQTETTSTQDLQNRLQRRDALHQLMNPMGLGGFGVLIQSKNVSEDIRLKGLMQQI